MTKRVTNIVHQLFPNKALVSLFEQYLSIARVFFSLISTFTPPPKTRSFSFVSFHFLSQLMIFFLYISCIFLFPAFLLLSLPLSPHFLTILPLWLRTTESSDIDTGPLAQSSPIRSFAGTAHLFGCSTLLASLACSAAVLICLLAGSLKLVRKWIILCWDFGLFKTISLWLLSLAFISPYLPPGPLRFFPLPLNKMFCRTFSE